MNRPQLFARCILAGIGLLVLALALSFAGCRAARPDPAEAATAEKMDSSPQKVDSPAEKVDSPGILSGLGTVFSTPAGRAHRQAVRLARAAGPRKLGKGAVYAPAAKQVVSAYKSRAGVAVAADSATVQLATNAVAGRGNTATQTATTQQAPSAGAVIAKAIAGPVGVVLAVVAAGAVAYLIYLIWAFLPRRKNNAA